MRSGFRALESGGSLSLRSFASYPETGGIVASSFSAGADRPVLGIVRHCGRMVALLGTVIVAVLAALPSSAVAAAVPTLTPGDGLSLGSPLTGASPYAEGAMQLAPTNSRTNRVMVLDVGPYGSADSVYARWPYVLEDADGSYKMWYSGFDGSRNRLLFATSPDGVHWEKHGVVIDIGMPPYYFDSVAGQTVIKVGATYHMWFQGGFWSGGPFGYWAQIYHAISADGSNWTITGVALPPNQPWDIGMTNTPWVLQDSHGVYWMYFFGWDGVNTRIGVATSLDGSSFTPYERNPVVELGPAGSWDSFSLLSPSVHLKGAKWTMYYEGSDGYVSQIGKATSRDGFNWTKSSSNPFIGPGPEGAWDSARVGTPAYFSGPFGQCLYYSGSDGTYTRIGLYTIHGH